MSKPDSAENDGELTGLTKAGPVAAFLDTTEFYLARLRYEGRGPAFVKMGRSVRYRWADVDRWVEQNKRTTSEAS